MLTWTNTIVLDM